MKSCTDVDRMSDGTLDAMPDDDHLDFLAFRSDRSGSRPRKKAKMSDFFLFGFFWLIARPNKKRSRSGLASGSESIWAVADVMSAR